MRSNPLARVRSALLSRSICVYLYCIVCLFFFFMITRSQIVQFCINWIATIQCCTRRPWNARIREQTSSPVITSMTAGENRLRWLDISGSRGRVYQGWQMVRQKSKFLSKFTVLAHCFSFLVVVCLLFYTWGLNIFKNLNASHSHLKCSSDKKFWHVLGSHRKTLSPSPSHKAPVYHLPPST